MKTLYININNESVQSNEELEVLSYDLDGDFFFYLGEKIAKGCNVENENALITEFNAQDNKEDFQQIISQWNDIKAILFSEECEGQFEFTLPKGYIHWLKFHQQYVAIYDKNFSNGEARVLSIDLEELYEDSVEELQRKILRRLKRDDLYLDIDEIVFNDDVVTPKSSIVRAIKGEIDRIGFKNWKKKDKEINKKENSHNFVSSSGNDEGDNMITRGKGIDIFSPIYGVMLGETSLQDIELSKTYIRNNDIQRLDIDKNFGRLYCWENDSHFSASNGIFESLYFTKYIREKHYQLKDEHVKMIPKWEKLGINWNMTFEQCLNFFQLIHFVISVVEPRYYRTSPSHAPAYIAAVLAHSPDKTVYCLFQFSTMPLDISYSPNPTLWRILVSTSKKYIQQESEYISGWRNMY